jgi:zinc protease
MRITALLSTVAAVAIGTAALGGAAEAQTRARPAVAAAQQTAVPPLQFTTRTLANGMKVYAIRDTSTANVATQMYYGVGSRDDPNGRSGFAHLFEHILSRVTRNIAPGQLNVIVEGIGGTRNAGTTADFTNYIETVPATHLETMLWAHAERMDRLVVNEDVFKAERDIVQEELRQSYLANPYGKISLALFTNSFETHPYKRPTIGNIEELRSAQLSDVQAFHDAYYRPDNATLVVVGNFDPAQLNAWVDKHLAPIKRPSTPILRFDAKETPRTAARTAVEYAANVPLPAIIWSYQTPGRTHPDGAALSVMNAILAQGRSSRLYKALVYDKQLATQASSNTVFFKEAGLLAPVVILAGGKKIEDAEAALAEEIAAMRDTQVSEAELAEAKSELVSSELFQRESASGRAGVLGRAIMIAGDPNFADKQLAAVQRVTAADVQRVAKQYLRDDRRVSIRYLDESARPASAVTQSVKSERLGLDLPPPARPANQLAAEGQRMAPPAPVAPRPVAAPRLAERTLPNGLRVVVAKSTEVPLSTAYLVFNGGATTDPKDRPGLATVAASLASKATETLSAPQLAARVEQLGAQVGGSASADGTTMFVAAPEANLEAAGRLLSDVVRRPAFAAAELERERKQRLDALQISLREPGYIASQAIGRVLYGDAPYGAPSGTPAALQALTREELQRHQQTWWRPDNATLILTGSLEPAEGFALAERLFADWRPPAGARPALPTNRAGAAAGPRVVVVDLPGAGQASVNVALRAIERKDADFYPLTVANAVLGGSSTGRLFQEVRVKRALSYGAYSNLATRRDEGFLSASAQTKNETADEVAEVLTAELARLRAEPLAADVLEPRKTFLTGAYARQAETTTGLGGILAGLALQDVPLSEFSRYAAGLGAVTPTQVGAALSGEIDPAQASIVIVGDAKAFLEPLRAKHPNVEVIPFTELDLASPTLRRAGSGAATAAR